MPLQLPQSVLRPLSVLRAGPFRRYMLGGAVSLTGTWMQFMAQAWVMTSLTNSAFLYSLVNFASNVPSLLLFSIGGSSADRYDKRMILVATQIVQMALAFLMGMLVLSHKLQIWHVVAIALLTGIAAAFETPADSAMVPELVDHSEIQQALAIDRSIFHGTRLLGPAVAGVVVALWGAATAFFLNAMSFLGFIGALATIASKPAQTPEEAEERSSGIGPGFAHVRSDPPTFMMLALSALTTCTIFPPMVMMLPLYARYDLGQGAAALGTLMGVSGVGSLTGSILLLLAPRDRRISAMAVSAVGAGVCVLALAFVHNVIAAGVLIGLLSIGTASMIGLTNTIIQERAPDALRGRVSAIAGLAFFGLLPFSGLAVMAAADMFGRRTIMAVAALIFIPGSAVILAMTARRWRSVPAAERDGSLAV